MINEAHISLSGYVATQPALRETRSGIPAVTMRVAWTPRRMDRTSGEWIDAGTSFATVQIYRKLAENAATCLRKGDPVVVRGRVTVREFEARNGQQRTVVEIDAISVGHDLSHGIATFHRIRPQTGMTAAEFRAAEESGLNGAMCGPEDADARDGASPGMVSEELQAAEPAGAEAGYPGGDHGGFRPAGDPAGPGLEAGGAGTAAGREDDGVANVGQQEADDQQEAADGTGAGRRKVGRPAAKEKALAQV
jgi:single-strand DNA-binding protein